MKVLLYLIPSISIASVAVLMAVDIFKRLRYATIQDIIEWYYNNQESETGLNLEWNAISAGYSVEEYIDLYYVTDLIVYIRKELI